MDVEAQQLAVAQVLVPGVQSGPEGAARRAAEQSYRRFRRLGTEADVSEVPARSPGLLLGAEEEVAG
ncbi:hypothetical protein [Streptomyces sp. SID14446]|uniref:hypothetical protein n=1 Tax=Streptomyces sp. SID14446 TaxID=2706072 RepID=UPI001EF1727A|nr:hypothetical protein [Streptomyces sp. SID14446]